LNNDTVDTGGSSNPRRAALIQFIKFGMVGFSNTAVSYLIYSALVYVDTPYIVANVAAFTISVLNAFFWNNKYVFKRDGNRQKRGFWGPLLKTYASYAVTGLVLNSILLYLFIDALQISKYIAPLLSLVVTVPANFALNKKWAFKT